MVLSSIFSSGQGQAGGQAGSDIATLIIKKLVATKDLE